MQGAGGLQARAPGATSSWLQPYPAPGAQAFSTPPWFRDDWLNGFYDLRRAARAPPSGSGAAAPLHEGAAAASDLAEADGGCVEGGEAGAAAGSQAGLATSDYRFLYLGPAGSHTPLHADVLRSYSWRALRPCAVIARSVAGVSCLAPNNPCCRGACWDFRLKSCKLLESPALGQKWTATCFDVSCGRGGDGAGR